MSPPASKVVDSMDRLLTFVVEDVHYALPISWVLEVAEKNRISSVPSLALPVGGVMNWHGEALPLVATELLLGRDRDEAGATPFGAATTVGYAQEQVLVIAAGLGGGARLGMPVDRVLGLLDGGGDLARHPGRFDSRPGRAVVAGAVHGGAHQQGHEFA